MTRVIWPLIHFYSHLTIWFLGLKLYRCGTDANLTQDCGKTKGCLFKPPNCKPFLSCTYFMSYSTNVTKDNSVVMQLLVKSTGPESQYVAVGFSNDTMMGNDSVTYCIYDAEHYKHAAGLSFNTPDNNHAVTDPVTSGHVVLESIEVLDGHILCLISQKVVPSFKSHQVWNLDFGYHLFLVSGPADVTPNRLKPHVFNESDTRYPFISENPINVAQFKRNTTSNNSIYERCVGDKAEIALVKAHGILMLFGWWLFVAMAEIIARYFRTFLPDNKLFGTPVWFNLHRGLNVCGILLIATAFTCIFIAMCGAWGGDNPLAYNHSVAGMAASIAAFAQPIMALFRCHPGDPGRWIFNWIHRIVGVAALGCACASIWFTSDFEGLGLHPTEIGGNGSAGKGLMIFYFVSIVLTIVLLELLITLTERLGSNPISEQADSAQLKIEPLRKVTHGLLTCSGWNLLRVLILATFFFLAIAICVTLSCFIGLAS